MKILLVWLLLACQMAATASAAESNALDKHSEKSYSNSSRVGERNLCVPCRARIADRNANTTAPTRAPVVIASRHKPKYANGSAAPTPPPTAARAASPNVNAPTNKTHHYGGGTVVPTTVSARSPARGRPTTTAAPATPKPTVRPTTKSKTTTTGSPTDHPSMPLVNPTLTLAPTISPTVSLTTSPVMTPAPTTTTQPVQTPTLVPTTTLLPVQQQNPSQNASATGNLFNPGPTACTNISCLNSNDDGQNFNFTQQNLPNSTSTTPNVPSASTSANFGAGPTVAVAFGGLILIATAVFIGQRRRCGVQHSAAVRQAMQDRDSLAALDESPVRERFSPRSVVATDV